MWKRIRKRWASLNRWKSMLTNIVRLWESEYTFDLIISYMFLHFEHIGIKMLNVLAITKYESLVWVKAECENIFDIIVAHLNSLMKFQFIFINIFFIICYLYYYRNIKDTLEILCENERDAMAKMKGLRWRAATCIEEKWFFLFECFQTYIEISVAKEYSTS